MVEYIRDSGIVQEENFLTVTEDSNVPATGHTYTDVEISDEELNETISDGQDVYRIVDIGCGAAGYHPKIYDKVEDTLDDIEVQVIGIDLNAEVLEAAKSGEYDYQPWSHTNEEYFEQKEDATVMKPEERDNLRLMTGDAENTPLKDDTADLTISQYLIMHLDDNKGEELKEDANRITKEEGIVKLLE